MGIFPPIFPNFDSNEPWTLSKSSKIEQKKLKNLFYQEVNNLYHADI
jgi:hypothetical protein